MDSVWLATSCVIRASSSKPNFEQGQLPTEAFEHTLNTPVDGHEIMKTTLTPWLKPGDSYHRVSERWCDFWMSQPSTLFQGSLQWKQKPEQRHLRPPPALNGWLSFWFAFESTSQVIAKKRYGFNDHPPSEERKNEFAFSSSSPSPSSQHPAHPPQAPPHPPPPPHPLRIFAFSGPGPSPPSRG